MSREIVVNGRFLSRRISGVERHGREVLSFIGDNCQVEKTPMNGVPGHIWEQFILPGKVNPESILWSPANSGPLSMRNQALTIHDLSPLENPQWFRKRFATWYRLFLPILAKRVRIVFTPSVYVKEKVCARWNVPNVIVTPNGVDHCVFRPDAEQHRYDLPERYILFLGTLEPRKNLNGLLQAWNNVKNDFENVWLVIAGTTGKVFKPVHFTPEMDRVHFLGFVEDNHLPGLYAGATLFVQPSFNEGFGLPALEAMACGVPVIASDGGALPEVIGGAGLIFNLAEPDSLPMALKECLQDEKLRTSLIEKGVARAQDFSWQETANIIWNTLHAI